jgi:diaphanous 1
MLYRRRLDLDVEEIRPDLNTLRNACHELRSSTRFKQVLQVEDLPIVVSMKSS